MRITFSIVGVPAGSKYLRRDAGALLGGLGSLVTAKSIPLDCNVYAHVHHTEPVRELLLKKSARKSLLKKVP